jgi:hypothetical protein
VVRLAKSDRHKKALAQAKGKKGKDEPDDQELYEQMLKEQMDKQIQLAQEQEANIDRDPDRYTLAENCIIFRAHIAA